MASIVGVEDLTSFFDNTSSAEVWSGAQNVSSSFVDNSSIESLKYDSNTDNLASRYGLNISSKAWEDTGRTKGSCWGPNISDMTLCVGERNMPIIRKPNFSDLTSDQDISSFNLTVGNENGSNLKQIPLKEYLENITKYTDAKVTGNLYNSRDLKILTSAQACILPLKDGQVEFAVRLYNYQSSVKPAVLVIVSSSQGTSAHFVLGRNNVLDFNKNGLKAKFLAERLRDDRAKRGVSLDGPMTDDEKIRNALLIFQVPLKYNAPSKNSFGSGAGFGASHGTTRGMDHGIISTTAGNGKYNSLSNFTVQRDDRMPIRCTIQYYHVTDETSISESDMATIASEVVRHNPISSLVTDSTNRPTEHSVPKPPSANPGGCLFVLHSLKY